MAYSDIRFEEREFNEILDDLDRTAVLSKEYKDRLFLLIMSGQRSAFENGKKAGIAEAKKATRKKSPRNLKT